MLLLRRLLRDCCHLNSDAGALVRSFGARQIVDDCRDILGGHRLGLFSVSAASGLPPASEKRATTGTSFPENKADREYAAISGVPTNVPSAQVPFA